MERKDTLRNFRFQLEIDSIKQAGFSEMAIAETTIDAVDYRVGNDPPHMRKLSGLTKYGNITLKSGVTFGANALELHTWFSTVSSGPVKARRRTVAIIVMDEAGAERARFVLSEAWPVKYDPSDLNAKGNEVWIEQLDLCHEGMERVK